MCTLVGLAFVVNGFRPVRVEPLSVPSFFAGWPTAELPLWHVAWQALATAAFAALGAFGWWPGRVGLGVMVVSWIGLGVLAVRAARAGRVLDEAFPSTLWSTVEGTVPLPVDGRDTMWRFPRLLWPFPRPVRFIRRWHDIDYAGDGSHRHHLDVMVRRDDPPAAGPVLVYVHGGAWVMGDKREQGLPMLFELARRGWVTVTINYGLSPKATWPQHVVDCKRAVAWVKEHIAEFGGDPSFVAVSGGSAGGHLCALLALTPGDASWQPGFEAADTAVDACVPFYGVYDFTGGGEDRRYGEGLAKLLANSVVKRTPDEDPETFRLASPLWRVSSAAPPFFVIHGVNDTLVPVSEARRFVAALREVSSSPVVSVEMPCTQHAFDVLPGVRGAHTTAAVVRFLEWARAGCPQGVERGRSR